MHKLGVITWVDATSKSEWQDIKDVKPDPVQVTTVGWIMHRDKKSVIVAQNMTAHNMCGMTMEIPMSWITKIKLVKGYK